MILALAKDDLDNQLLSFKEVLKHLLDKGLKVNMAK